MKLPRIGLIDRVNAEDSLHEFVRQAWPVLEPSTAFVDNWHLHLVCEYLEALAQGDILRLIINVPPRSGKSIFATVSFPCWLWLKNPALRMMAASYSGALSTDHSVARRTVLTSQWFRSNWPNLRLADDANLKTAFSNTARGMMIATSVGASPTGRGGDLIIADDLLSPHQANSDLERATAARWFNETLFNRLDDKKQGRILVIEQRTHANDLTGSLLEQGGFTHLALGAVAARKTTITFPRSGRIVIREEGDLLWPEREGEAQLAEARLRMGSFAFDSQYLQAPTSRGGNLFKAEHLVRYSDLPQRFDRMVMSLDTAFKTGPSNDYSAAVLVGVLNRADGLCAPGFYVLFVWRGRVEFGALKRKVVELAEAYNPELILIEDAASGQPLLQELRDGTSLILRPCPAVESKEVRAVSVEPIVESGRLLLPESAPWLADFESELLGFPGAAHDDQVDALTQALTYLRANGANNVLQFYQAVNVGTAMDGFSKAMRPGGPRELSVYERKRFEREAGVCVDCGSSLLAKSSYNDGRGRHCMACGQKPVLTLGTHACWRTTPERSGCGCPGTE
jgi:predicted phage terminase large subunit-like protein